MLQTGNQAGSSSSGPLEFVRDTVTVQVTKDTVTPANTLPLPVEIVAASGTPINVTAGDLNVQLSDTGANYDITRIGDGTNQMTMNASNETLVSDPSALAKLTSIDGKLSTPMPVTGPLTDTQLRASAVPVSGPLTDTQLRASAVPVSGPLTDTQLRASAVPVSLTSTTVTNTVAVSGPLTDTQLRASAVPVSMTSTTITGTVAVSAASLPLPAGAATETTLAGLHYTQGSTTSGQSGPLAQGAVTTASPAYTTGQTAPLSLTTLGSLRTTASINSFAGTAIGQKTMANSMPIVIASDQTSIPVTGSFTAGANTGFTRTVVTLGAATQTSVLAVNASRKTSLIQNVTGADIWFGLGTVTNSGSTRGLKVPDEASYQFENTAQLYAYSVAGGDVVVIEET